MSTLEFINYNDPAKLITKEKERMVNLITNDVRSFISNKLDILKEEFPSTLNTNSVKNYLEKTIGSLEKELSAAEQKEKEYIDAMSPLAQKLSPLANSDRAINLKNIENVKLFILSLKEMQDYFLHVSKHASVDKNSVGILSTGVTSLLNSWVYDNGVKDAEEGFTPFKLPNDSNILDKKSKELIFKMLVAEEICVNFLALP